jgi:histidine ammonia-lyase
MVAFSSFFGQFHCHCELNFFSLPEYLSESHTTQSALMILQKTKAGGYVHLQTLPLPINQLMN